MDFWNGRVSAGDYKFKDGEKTFNVKHEVLTASNLRRSTIQIEEMGQHLQEVVFAETSTGEVELYVDGKLKTRVNNINEIPTANHFDGEGNLVSQNMILTPVVAKVGGQTVTF